MAGRVETLKEMQNANFKFLNKSVCKACKQPIEWWLTTEKKKIPYDPISTDIFATVTTHWATCPHAESFRGTGAAAKAEDTRLSREKQVGEFRDRTNARAIIALYDEGPVLAWRGGIPGEDFRNEAIAAANRLRNAVTLHGERAK